MYANGWGDDGERPLRVGPPVIDYGTGMQAAFAVAAALFQRQRTGKGQNIDLAMADAALMLMTAHVGQTLATGKTPPAYGNENIGRPSNSAYQTQEGWLVVAAYTKTQFSKFTISLRSRVFAFLSAKRIFGARFWLSFWSLVVVLVSVQHSKQTSKR